MHIPSALYSSLRFIFLYVDKYEFKSGWVFPESVTPYCMLRYIIKGNAVFEINGTSYNIHKCQVVYIPEGSMLKCYSKAEEFSFISIRFVSTLQLRGNDFLQEFFAVPLVTDTNSGELENYFTIVYKTAYSHNPDKMFRIRGYLELIIADLVALTHNGDMQEIDLSKAENENIAMSIENIYHREMQSKERLQKIKHDPRIQIVLNYLIAHPCESFDTKKLCGLSGLSSSSLRRLFKDFTGKSPSKFTKELKMLAAARKILISDEPISLISYELGYEDPNYFSRLFRSCFGLSPQKYRLTARIPYINLSQKNDK